VSVRFAKVSTQLRRPRVSLSLPFPILFRSGFPSASMISRFSSRIPREDEVFAGEEIRSSIADNLAAIYNEAGEFGESIERARERERERERENIAEAAASLFHLIHEYNFLIANRRDLRILGARFATN